MKPGFLCLPAHILSENVTNVREALEGQIELHAAILSALIDVLDGMDGDCDFEPNGDLEPWLGWTAGMSLANSLDLEPSQQDELVPPIIPGDDDLRQGARS